MIEPTEPTTRQLPELPERLTRWTVDRHYTALVDALRDGGPPGRVSEQAHRQLVAQVRTGFPDSDVPEYVRRLGEDPNAPETSDSATATEETAHE